MDEKIAALEQQLAEMQKSLDTHNMRGDLLSGNTQEQLQTIYDTYSQDMPNYTWYRFAIAHGVSFTPLAGGAFFVFGFKSANCTKFSWHLAMGKERLCAQKITASGANSRPSR